ncbi:hypothetical protein SAMN05428988_6559 [Chitinophaga sp. YR573]|uniref:hypothetical protein n=1 Tax=Chitinophaga sp. YR573 TaxID=1881040 RepID=UPI0008C2AD6A|nr:hypothetical protein [Chitinophaga sp. YR573]SEW46849.1 hypothetical protein SAMN05428988_6559 [Chitinophaga sp. YR573]
MNNKKLTLPLLVVSLLFGLTTSAQFRVNPEQKKIAAAFMSYLEHHAVKDAENLLISPSVKQQAQIARAEKEIAKIVGKTELSIIQVEHGNGNLFRARYWIEGERYDEYYQADIIFDNPSSSKISKVKFFGRKELVENAKWREKHSNTPPALPPPQIH